MIHGVGRMPSVSSRSPRIAPTSPLHSHSIGRYGPSPSGVSGCCRSKRTRWAFSPQFGTCPYSEARVNRTLQFAIGCLTSWNLYWSDFVGALANFRSAATITLISFAISESSMASIMSVGVIVTPHTFWMWAFKRESTSFPGTISSRVWSSLHFPSNAARSWLVTVESSSDL